MTSVERRKELSKKAWAECFARLFALAGQDWPTGANLSSPEIVEAEHKANEATAAYVERGRDGAREALKAWEDLMVAAIRREKDKRGCGVCGHEKVAEVVMDDGTRACGRCRRGEPVGG